MGAQAAMRSPAWRASSASDQSTHCRTRMSARGSPTRLQRKRHTNALSSPDRPLNATRTDSQASRAEGGAVASRLLMMMCTTDLAERRNRSGCNQTRISGCVEQGCNSGRLARRGGIYVSKKHILVCCRTQDRCTEVSHGQIGSGNMSRPGQTRLAHGPHRLGGKFRMSLMARFSSVSGFRARSTMPLVTLLASFWALRSAGFSLPTSGSCGQARFLNAPDLCQHLAAV